MLGQDNIMSLLKDLKERHASVEACMVARRGLEGLIMFPESFKQDVGVFWEPLSRNLNDVLIMVGKYGSLGQKRLYSEIFGYGMLFLVVEMSDTALVVFIKGERPLAGIGGLLDDMEATKDNIVAG